MNARDAILAGALASAGLLVYGCLVAANRLVVERRTLRLPHWPESLRGYKIAVLADLHVRDECSIELGKRAVDLALDEDPDIVVLPGDLIAYWKLETPWMLEEVLAPLALLRGSAVATPGNREYWEGRADWLRPILESMGIRYLRNEVWLHQGIQWIGLDSANLGRPDPEGCMAQVDPHRPAVALWHEPDMVDRLPRGADLMISGHTHGGQFRAPWGWAPMKTRNGERYLEGFFPDAPTPLYVSRGIGTTGPPSRLNCPPEVSVLSLEGF